MNDDDKWGIIEVKITKEEREIIDKIKKKKGFNTDGDFLRRAIEDLTGISVADASRQTNPLPPQYITVYNFWQKYRQILESNPKEQEKFDHFFQGWKNKFFNRWIRKGNKKLQKAHKIWTPFREHEGVGRPKSPKRKRGKPIDKGYER